MTLEQDFRCFNLATGVFINVEQTYKVTRSCKYCHLCVSQKFVQMFVKTFCLFKPPILLPQDSKVSFLLIQTMRWIKRTHSNYIGSRLTLYGDTDQHTSSSPQSAIVRSHSLWVSVSISKPQINNRAVGWHKQRFHMNRFKNQTIMYLLRKPVS